MAEPSLASLVERGWVRDVVGDGSVRVSGVRHDSRHVEPGDLFVALEGDRRDGAVFARDAIERGAVAVLASRPLQLSVPVAVSSEPLVALAAIAREVYDDPSRALQVVGITGTNGKTTTSYLVEAMLAAAGKQPAVIGTIEVRGPGGRREPTHTTPMADDLMRIVQWMARTGASHLVIEVSSHGLAMHRVDGLRFAVAAFTNLTQDHLDYHGDMASYAAAKARLFTDLAPGCAVLNVDDPVGLDLARRTRGQVLRCSRHADTAAEIRALAWKADRAGIEARVATPDGEVALHSPLLGAHNLDNLLVALGCGVALGLDAGRAAEALAHASGAPGRLQRIPARELLVFVDYAHTPDALARALGAVRPLTSGKLWVVFGCGGDRDPDKRALMGQAAAELADAVVVTNDNPRSEAPEVIAAAIERGVRARGMTEESVLELAKRDGYAVVLDRHAAITSAIAAAAPGDTVLIAGKGHEKVQIVGARRLPFDDCTEAQRALAAREGAT